jgi:RNA-directed DNA polymerase
MSKPREKNTEPVKVPFAANPAGEPPSVNDWANPCVWTERMLTALPQGVRGGKWHALIDKVYAPLNLSAASRHVIGNGGAAGVDHQTVEAFLARQPKELHRLYESLRADTYRPQAVRRVQIPKPGSRETRPLGIPTVRDRVVQTALLHVLEPIFDVTFSEHSYWTVFRALDGWIRGRLRSLLRKRRGCCGRARGTDHQRWPNHFFAAHGLYSLHAAYVRFAQSSLR